MRGDLDPLVLVAFGAREVQCPVIAGLPDVLEAHGGRLRAAGHAVEERLNERPVAKRAASPAPRPHEPLGLLARGEDAPLHGAHLGEAVDEFTAGRIVVNKTQALSFAHRKEPLEESAYGRDLAINGRCLLDPARLQVFQVNPHVGEASAAGELRGHWGCKGSQTALRRYGALFALRVLCITLSYARHHPLFAASTRSLSLVGQLRRGTVEGSMSARSPLAPGHPQVDQPDRAVELGKGFDRAQRLFEGLIVRGFPVPDKNPPNQPAPEPQTAHRHGFQAPVDLARHVRLASRRRERPAPGPGKPDQDLRVRVPGMIRGRLVARIVVCMSTARIPATCGAVIR